MQMIGFVGWACACIAMIGKVEVGLDQKLSMPQVRHLSKTHSFCAQVTYKVQSLRDTAYNLFLLKNNHFM